MLYKQQEGCKMTKKLSS